MKLKLKDKVMVTAGRDKGKTGEIIAILPKANKIVVDNINIAKRHMKPTQSNPRGGIVEVSRPLDVSKVQVLDPKTNKPARVSYKLNASGVKERVFKVSAFSNKKATKKTPAKSEASKKAEAAS